MKAKVKLALPGFTGNMNDLVIYYNRQHGTLIARRKVTPTFTPDPRVMQEIFALARRLPLSSAYKADCSKYVLAYNTHFRRKNKALCSWSNIWLQIIRALLKQHPEIVLAEMQREDLISLGCGSIAAAVDSGWIAQVPGCEKLLMEI